MSRDGTHFREATAEDRWSPAQHLPPADGSRWIILFFRHRGVLVVLALALAALVPAHDGGVGQLLLAAALIIGGSSARIAGVRQIGSRAKVYTASARELLTSGIFGHIRNPLYLGNALVAAGVFALLRSAACVPLAILALLVVYSVVASHEENGLRAQFGAAYESYCRAVSRWIPRVRPYQPRGSRAAVAWRAVFRSERGFIIGCSAALLVIVLAASGVEPVIRARRFLMDVDSGTAALAMLLLATWLVIKIEVYRPLKRAFKRRLRGTQSG